MVGQYVSIEGDHLLRSPDQITSVITHLLHSIGVRGSIPVQTVVGKHMCLL